MTTANTFNINGKSSDYGWGLRDDGVEGIVVWKGTWWTHLAKGTDICFTDATIDTDYLFVQPGSTYQINGNSADYGWGLRDDGVEGIVVWKGSWWVHLPKGADIQFADKTVDTDYLFSGGNTGGGNSGSSYNIDGNSADYGWGLRDDGVEGIVVWKGSWWVHLAKGTDLCFNDRVVDTDYLFNGSTNHAPVANDDAFSGLAGAAVSGNVLTNDTDADGDKLTAVLDSGPANGTLTLNADGTFSYTPKAGFTGSDSFVYHTEDGKQACDTATVTITVTPNETPKTASIGDKVWLDANKNGVQDNNEAGVSGVTVQLKDAAGNIIASQVTDSSGNYLFDKLAAGEYQVGVTAPSQYELTAKDAFNNGADGIDSDVNVSTGHTDTISLKDGDAIRTVDAGLIAKAPPASARLPSVTWCLKTRTSTASRTLVKMALPM